MLKYLGVILSAITELSLVLNLERDLALYVFSMTTAALHFSLSWEKFCQLFKELLKGGRFLFSCQLLENSGHRRHSENQDQEGYIGFWGRHPSLETAEDPT